MKLVRLLALALLLAAPAARAAENKYDVMARVLMPFAQLLAEHSRSAQRAVQLTARLESMTDLPPALAGARAELALEYPDKLRLRAPVLGEMLTICRDGQRLWVTPGRRAAELLATATAQKKLPPADPKARLAPFRLPVPEKQLVFLPALFRVGDAGAEAIDGETCRVLDLQLVPEVEQSLSGEPWNARVWVRENGTPARLLVQWPERAITVRFERVEFSKSLAPATWQPDDADVLKLTPAQYFRLVSALVK